MSGGSVQPVTPTTPLVRTDRLDHVHLYAIITDGVGKALYESVRVVSVMKGTIY